MLLHNSKHYYSDVVNARGNEDYVKDGKIYKNESMQMVLDSDSCTYTDDGEGNITVEEADNGE